MTVRELLTKWKFESDDKALDKVEGKLEAIKHRMDFLTSVEILKGLFELTEKFSHFALDLHEAAGNAGITVEAFQRLSAAGQKSGLSAEEMSTSMARLSRTLYEAKTGGKEAQTAFMRAGFTFEQIQGLRNGDDALKVLSGNLQKINDPIKKSALAMELMGRGGYKMVTFLSQGPGAINKLGKEAQELGYVMGKEQVEALLKAEHAFTDLWMAMKGFANTIAAFVAPEVEAIIKELLAFWKINKDLILLNVKSWLSDFAYGLGFVWGIIKIVSQAVLDFSKNHQTLTKVIVTLIMGFVGLVTTLLVALKLFAMFHTALDTSKKVVSFGKDLWAVVTTIKQWGIWSRIASAATWLWNAAMGVLTTEVAIIEAPLWLVIAAIGALVLAAQALWTVFTGGDFKDTWIGQAFDAIKSGGSALLGMLGLGGGGEPSEAGGGANSTMDTLKNMQNVGGIVGVPPSLTGGGGGGGNSSVESNYSMNAPINIMVPEGTNGKEIGEKARAGIKDHMDRVLRETHRNVRPAEAY